MPDKDKNKILLEKLFNANPIKGKFCTFYHVDINDAELIYKLRTKRKNSFLKETEGDIEDQKNYLRNYLESFSRKEQIYYKIFDIQKQKFSGVLRLTELLNEKIFNWQSFVAFEDSSPNLAIDAMLMLYRIGFEFLERDFCGPWEVDKEFIKMIKIHNFIKIAKMIEDKDGEKYCHFAVKRRDYVENINKFLKMGYGGLDNLL